MTVVDRIVVIVLACLVVTTDVAHAQRYAAEALFREGRTLIKQGKLKEGCAKFEESEKLDSSVGTLLNLGDCREKLGEPAAAWAAFRKAEALAKQSGNDNRRQQEARRRADKLEADLGSITVLVGPTAKREGLVIKRDGELVAPDLWGTAIVVDPGSHVIVAEAPGHQPWRSEVSIDKGDKRWVVVPTLERERAKQARRATRPPVAVTRPPSTEPPSPPPSTEPPSRPPPSPPPVVAVDAPAPAPHPMTVQETWSTTRGLAVGLAVLGAAAIGTGIYFGDRANDLEDRSNAICPTAICDDVEGLRLNDHAQDNALRANVLFAAGGAAVAVATVMWFVGKPDETTVITPTLGDTHVGASLTGRF